MSERNLDIRITAASDRGFVVWEASVVVAALTTRAEVAEWLEQRLGLLPGEIEREAQDRQQTIDDLPNVIRARTAPPKSRLWQRSST